MQGCISKVCFGCLISMLATERLAAQDLTKSDSHAYLVLKNGRLFAGQVQSSDTGYAVKRPNGVVVRFQKEEVDFVASSMFQAYTQLRFRLPARDLSAHIDLAQWCLRYKDAQSAQDQIRYLESLADRFESNDSRTVAQLKTQLVALRAAATNAEQPSLVQHTLVKQLPSVSADQSQQMGPVRDLTTEELEAAMERIPKSARIRFNMAIQPRLVNGCTAAKCHVDGQAPMQLYRTRRGTRITSRTTQHNLHSVMKFIDHSNPLESPLLAHLRTQHGGLQDPVYPSDSEHYRVIREWVMQVGNLSDVAQVHVDPAITPASYSEPVEESPLKESSLEESIDAGITTTKDNQNLGSATTSKKLADEFVPRDEFDPEIFNRKHQKPGAKANKKTRPLPPVDDGKK